MIKGTKNNIASIYDRIADVAGTDFASSVELGLIESEHFLKGIPPNSLILDTGPGKGIESKIAIELGHSVIGLDISQKMLNLFLNENSTAVGVLGSVADIPDSCNKVDAIHSSCCILHLDKETGKKAISEFWRVLKKGGQLFLVTTISESSEEEINVNDGLVKMGVGSWYFFHWKASDLRQVIENCGFVISSWKQRNLIPDRPDLAIIIAKKESPSK